MVVVAADGESRGKVRYLLGGTSINPWGKREMYLRIIMYTGTYHYIMLENTDLGIST